MVSVFGPLLSPPPHFPLGGKPHAPRQGPQGRQSTAHSRSLGGLPGMRGAGGTLGWLGI